MNGMEEGQVRLNGQYCNATEGSWLMILGQGRVLKSHIITDLDSNSGSLPVLTG